MMTDFNNWEFLGWDDLPAADRNFARYGRNAHFKGPLGQVLTVTPEAMSLAMYEHDVNAVEWPYSVPKDVFQQAFDQPEQRMPEYTFQFWVKSPMADDPLTQKFGQAIFKRNNGEFTVISAKDLSDGMFYADNGGAPWEKYHNVEREVAQEAFDQPEMKLAA